MRSIWKEIIIKFIVHSTIFGLLIYFLNDYSLQKSALIAISFGIMMSLYNLYQKKKNKK